MPDCLLKVKKPPAPGRPKDLTPALDPNDPFADDEKERREVEAIAKKFESKYVGSFTLWGKQIGLHRSNRLNYFHLPCIFSPSQL